MEKGEKSGNRKACSQSRVLKNRVYGCALALLFIPVHLASAVEIKGVHFQDAITIDEHRVKVRGAALLRWLFFKVYVVALYLPEHATSDEVLHDIPKRMEFRYFVNMTAEQFAESAEPYLKKNVPKDELAALRPKINEFNHLYRDVSAGDRYTLTYVPGKGTELALNGEVLGRIEGHAFAAAYYRIWLGEHPLDEDLKQGLLNPDDREN